MTNDDRSLATLRAEIRAADVLSMPLAGLILWSVGAIAGLLMPPRTFAVAVLWGTGCIFPLAILIAKLRGKNFFANRDHPLTKLFLLSILFVVAFYPIAIIGAVGKPLLLVLYPAIAAGMIWIPWGWTVGDPVGLRHGIARTIGCYLAYAFVPAPWTGTAICLVVVAAYLYSFSVIGRWSRA